MFQLAQVILLLSTQLFELAQLSKRIILSGVEVLIAPLEQVLLLLCSQLFELAQLSTHTILSGVVVFPTNHVRCSK